MNTLWQIISVLSLLLMNSLYSTVLASAPLNLSAPDDHLVQTETFSLCDLSIEVFRNYCFNKGICYTLIDRDQAHNYKFDPQKNSVLPDIFCSCVDGYTGLRCETLIETSFHQIVNQIVQKSNISNYTTSNKDTSLNMNRNLLTSCPADFKCLNGGTCYFDSTTGPKCVCMSNFLGLNCEQAKYCPDMANCKLKCDFGYRRINNCETCACNCVNEMNYIEEMKKSLLASHRQPNSFCQKSCRFGFVKNEFNCYKCECIEESIAKLAYLTLPMAPVNQHMNHPTAMNNNQLMNGIVNKQNQNCLETCRNDEMCINFDFNMYKCPQERMNCTKYLNERKFSVCIPINYPSECVELVKFGSCSKYTERYYFDPIDRTCKRFYYSGCGANRNNFASLQECSIACSKQYTNNYANVDNKHFNSHIKPFESKMNNTVKVPLSLVHFTSSNSPVYKTKPMNTNIPSSPSSKSATTFTSQHLSSKPISQDIFQTISIPNAQIAPFEYNLNKTHNSTIEVDDSNFCQWICDLNCPFGYKLNQRTKCYKCECIDLNMTDCGVPCFLEGTQTCLYSLRANSRPNCVCNPNYEGVYCQMLKLSFNYTVRIDRSFKLNQPMTNEIKLNLGKKISKLLDIGTNQIKVHELRNNLKDNSFIIQFGIYAPDFSNETYFYSLVDILNTQINIKNFSLTIFNQDFVVFPHCEKSEETVLIDLNEKYLFRSIKIKSMIKDVKEDLANLYGFSQQSLRTVKLKIEPNVQMEITVNNGVNDPEFCHKSYSLMKDIRIRKYSLNKFDLKYLSVASDMEDKRHLIEEKNAQELADLVEQFGHDNVYLSRSSADRNLLKHLTPSFMNHGVVFVAIIITSFLVLMFLIGLVILTQLRRKQSKEISKAGDTSSRSSLDHYDKHTSEFAGYFLPNYTLAPKNQGIQSSLRSTPTNHKISLVAY